MDDLGQLILRVVEKPQPVVIDVPVFGQQPALGRIGGNRRGQGKILADRGIAVTEDIALFAPAQGKIRVVGVNTVRTGGR